MAHRRFPGKANDPMAEFGCFSDELTATVDTIKEAQFDTDFVVAFESVQVSMTVEALWMGGEKYWLKVSAGLGVVHDHKLLSMGGRAMDPDKFTQYFPFNYDLNASEAVRRNLMYHMEEVTKRLTSRFAA